MQIIYHLKEKNIDRIAVTFQGIEYIYVFDQNNHVISFFTGDNLIAKYKELYDSGFEGCIECQLTNEITRGISKDLDDIVEYDLKIPEANSIIKMINKQLNSNFPEFL